MELALLGTSPICIKKDREGAIRHTIEDYKRINSGTDDVEDYEQNIPKLIEKKLEMFPHIKKIIVDARIEPLRSDLSKGHSPYLEITSDFTMK